MKYFPYLLHFILACVALGVAAGLDAENARALYCRAANGLAVGLGASAFVRGLFLAFNSIK